MTEEKKVKKVKKEEGPKENKALNSVLWMKLKRGLGRGRL